MVREGGYLIIDDTASFICLRALAGCMYAARLKSNRLFEGQAVRARWPHRFGRGVGRLCKVSHEVCVVKDGRRYFVTNETGLSSSGVKRQSRQRQQIEEVFRLLKQEFGWGGASGKKRERM